MNERDMIELLTEALYFNDEENENNQVKDIKTFYEANLITGNNGIVVKMNDGTEFQITVVQSN